MNTKEHLEFLESRGDATERSVEELRQVVSRMSASIAELQESSGALNIKLDNLNAKIDRYSKIIEQYVNQGPQTYSVK